MHSKITNAYGHVCEVAAEGCVLAAAPVCNDDDDGLAAAGAAE